MSGIREVKFGSLVESRFQDVFLWTYGFRFLPNVFRFKDWLSGLLSLGVGI